MTKHLIIPDQHAHPDYHNDRADWLGQLIKDIRPDVVINIGDGPDLPSLALFDKGKASFAARNYEADIVSHLDFQERTWAPMRRSKKKQPRRVYLKGNHDFRIDRAIDLAPELQGERFGLSPRDLDLEKYYHEIVEYEGNTPGVIQIDGISYAHYFISGVLGKAMSNVHHAAALITKNLTSSIVGHSHMVDWAVRTTPQGKKIMGLVCGVYQDYNSPWAGTVNALWWRGVVVLHDVEDGVYNPSFISIEKLKKEYG